MTNRMKELEIKDRFDFVVCSHFLWQVRDLEKAFEKEIIEQYVSREGLHKEKRPAVVM